MRFPSLMIAAVLALTGCMKVTYTTGLPAGGATTTHKATFYVYGLAGSENFDMRSICPDGVAWFQSRQDIPDWLLTCITCSLYCPTTVEVRCASGRSMLAVPDADNDVTWVYDLNEEGGAL